MALLVFAVIAVGPAGIALQGISSPSPGSYTPSIGDSITYETTYSDNPYRPSTTVMTVEGVNHSIEWGKVFRVHENTTWLGGGWSDGHAEISGSWEFSYNVLAFRYIGNEVIVAGWGPVNTTHYRLANGVLDIDVWLVNGVVIKQIFAGPAGSFIEKAVATNLPFLLG